MELRKYSIKYKNVFSSLSINIFPFFFGRFIFPLKHCARTEFLYFKNVFLVVVISLFPPILHSIISFSFKSFFSDNNLFNSFFLFVYCFEYSILKFLNCFFFSIIFSFPLITSCLKKLNKIKIEKLKY